MANQQFRVISSNYCAPNRVNLQINTDKGITYDINGNAVFNVKDTFLTLHNRRLLCDGQGNPIVTLYEKNMTLHDRCQVFRGKSNNPSELLFSVKRSSIIPDSKMNKFEVFLADNKNEDACDFRVVVYRGKSSCNVYAGESPKVIATMKNNGGFNVNVHSNVDHAFIVALLMIVDEMEDSEASSTLATDVTTAVIDEVEEDEEE